MTDFIITPEDVGRVAVNDQGDALEIVAVTEIECCAKFLESNELFLFNERGTSQRDDIMGHLTHWKPRILEAPKRWWNVFVRPEGRDNSGEAYAHDHVTYRTAVAQEENTFGNKPIARIYDHHWHGCEEGRFDVPDNQTQEG